MNTIKEVNANPNPTERLEEALEELEYMEKHPDEYPKYDNMDDLIKALDED